MDPLLNKEVGVILNTCETNNVRKEKIKPKVVLKEWISLLYDTSYNNGTSMCGINFYY